MRTRTRTECGAIGGALLGLLALGVGCSSPGGVQGAESRGSPEPASLGASDSDRSAPAEPAEPAQPMALEPSDGEELGGLQADGELVRGDALAGSEGAVPPAGPNPEASEPATEEPSPPANPQEPVEGEPGDTGAESPTCALEVVATTVEIGGRYEPRNAGAIWVADDSGKFVKSLEVWGNRRLRHVEAWNDATAAAGVARNDVDAITSATLRTHGQHSVSWNCRDFDDQPLPDGDYRVYFEQTESNRAGPIHFESFSKGPEAVSLKGNSRGFADIALDFTP